MRLRAQCGDREEDGLRIKDAIDGYMSACEEAIRAHLSEQEQAAAASGMELMLQALSHTGSTQ
jgi:hypothetical protein